MKLDRLAFSQSFAVGLALVATVALACGCSGSVGEQRSVRTASAAPLSAEAANRAGTTNLMSAQLAGPAPRVGKSHLVVDDLTNLDGIEGSGSSELDAPKEARRSDGSRRSGGFGSSK